MIINAGTIFEVRFYATCPRIEPHLARGHTAQNRRDTIVRNLDRQMQRVGSAAVQDPNAPRMFGTVHRCILEFIGTSGAIRASGVLCMTAAVNLDTRSLDGQIISSLNWESGVTEADAWRVTIDANRLPTPFTGVVDDDSYRRLLNPSESTTTPTGAPGIINRVIALPETRGSSERSRDGRTGAGLAVTDAGQSIQSGLQSAGRAVGPALNGLGQGVGQGLSSLGTGLMTGLGMPPGLVTGLAITGGVVGGILLLSVAYRVARSNVR